MLMTYVSYVTSLFRGWGCWVLAHAPTLALGHFLPEQNNQQKQRTAHLGRMASWPLTEQRNKTRGTEQEVGKGNHGLDELRPRQ